MLSVRTMVTMLVTILSIVRESYAEDMHKLRFFLHPDLASGIPPEVLASRLSQYADDIKAVFAKQTAQRFTFDPAHDITITNTKPHTDYSSGVIPELGFELWIHAVLSDVPTYGTYGGYAGIDVSGAGVAAGLKWDAVHDPSTLANASEELSQYWRQIDHIVHEFEHVFGAGNGEYYNVRYVDDRTGNSQSLTFVPSQEMPIGGRARTILRIRCSTTFTIWTSQVSPRA